MVKKLKIKTPVRVDVPEDADAPAVETHLDQLMSAAQPLVTGEIQKTIFAAIEGQLARTEGVDHHGINPVLHRAAELLIQEAWNDFEARVMTGTNDKEIGIEIKPPTKPARSTSSLETAIEAINKISAAITSMDGRHSKLSADVASASGKLDKVLNRIDAVERRTIAPDDEAAAQTQTDDLRKAQNTESQRRSQLEAAESALTEFATTYGNLAKEINKLAALDGDFTIDAFLGVLNSLDLKKYTDAAHAIEAPDLEFTAWTRRIINRVQSDTPEAPDSAETDGAPTGISKRRLRTVVLRSVLSSLLVLLAAVGIMLAKSDSDEPERPVASKEAKPSIDPEAKLGKQAMEAIRANPNLPALLQLSKTKSAEEFAARVIEAVEESPLVTDAASFHLTHVIHQQSHTLHFIFNPQNGGQLQYHDDHLGKGDGHIIVAVHPIGRGEIPIGNYPATTHEVQLTVTCPSVPQLSFTFNKKGLVADPHTPYIAKKTPLSEEAKQQVLDAHIQQSGNADLETEADFGRHLLSVYGPRFEKHFASELAISAKQWRGLVDFADIHLPEITRDYDMVGINGSGNTYSLVTVDTAFFHDESGFEGWSEPVLNSEGNAYESQRIITLTYGVQTPPLPDATQKRTCKLVLQRSIPTDEMKGHSYTVMNQDGEVLAKSPEHIAGSLTPREVRLRKYLKHAGLESEAALIKHIHELDQVLLSQTVQNIHDELKAGSAIPLMAGPQRPHLPLPNKQVYAVGNVKRVKRFTVEGKQWVQVEVETSYEGMGPEWNMRDEFLFSPEYFQSGEQ